MKLAVSTVIPLLLATFVTSTKAQVCEAVVFMVCISPPYCRPHACFGRLLLSPQSLQNGYDDGFDPRSGKDINFSWTGRALKVSALEQACLQVVVVV